MKSCIENELKRKQNSKKNSNTTKEPRTYILASDRSTSKPTGHSVARLQSTDISCTMLAYIGLYITYIQRACVMRYRVQPMPNCENAPHNASVVAIFELIRAFDDILLAMMISQKIQE